MARIAQQSWAADDARWAALDAAMRRYGYRGDALIEVLHAAQEAFGHLHPEALRYVARALRLPLSKVFGVATFFVASVNGGAITE